MKKFQTYSFPLKLKMLRLETGKSQEEFSKELGISRSCLANYETGKRQPSSALLSKIAQICNVLPTFLSDRHPYQTAFLNESEMSGMQRLREFTQEHGTSLDISQLSIEQKISIIQFYEYVLNQQDPYSNERTYRF